MASQESKTIKRNEIGLHNIFTREINNDTKAYWPVKSRPYRTQTDRRPARN